MPSSSRFISALPAWLMIATALAPPLAGAGQNEPTDHAITATADMARGRALYQSSCDGCHSQNIHWRNKRLVSSWATLVNEVTRWQRNAGQRWEPSDISNVAAYLNDRFYRLPCPANECAEKEAAAR
jgi:mono/diheme cytochrome c family protein